MAEPKIACIEAARLVGQRPRKAGSNARLGEHGLEVRPQIARVTCDDGHTGWGFAPVTPEQADALLGCPLSDGSSPPSGLAERLRAVEYPLWDLAGKRAGQPVYALLNPASAGPFRAPCYDTSLYMDDLHLADDAQAAALLASEAQEGMLRGHRHFKLKIGRGAMHMPLEEGTRRDIQIIRAVRSAVGPGARLMLDANNGYNVNLAKRVLSETAADDIYWLEEPFHEDARLYGHLKEWLAAQGLKTLIADGEGEASRNLVDWAKQGLVDVLQYDIFGLGLARWAELGPQLDGWHVRSGPHHYGEPTGNYYAAHLSAAIQRFEAVEWDDAALPGVDATGYAISEGYVSVPNRPGFGLLLDEAYFARVVAESGFTATG